jgi:hypothetical protein
MPTSTIFPGEMPENHLTERRKTMFLFRTAEEPTPRLGRLERWLLYGTGCRIICLAAAIVNHLLTLVYYIVDSRNSEEEDVQKPPDVHESAQKNP